MHAVFWQSGRISESELLLQKEAPKRNSLSLRIQWDVLKKDNYRCVKCGARPPDVRLEIDHKIPISKGGGNSLENLQTLCDICNQGKSDRFE